MHCTHTYAMVLFDKRDGVGDDKKYRVHGVCTDLSSVYDWICSVVVACFQSAEVADYAHYNRYCLFVKSIDAAQVLTSQVVR